MGDIQTNFELIETAINNLASLAKLFYGVTVDAEWNYSTTDHNFAQTMRSAEGYIIQNMVNGGISPYPQEPVDDNPNELLSFYGALISHATFLNDNLSLYKDSYLMPNNFSSQGFAGIFILTSRIHDCAFILKECEEQYRDNTELHRQAKSFFASAVNNLAGCNLLGNGVFKDPRVVPAAVTVPSNTTNLSANLANDASGIANTLTKTGLDDVINNIFIHYHASHAHTLTRWRFKDRRMLQLDTLNNALKLEDPAQKMAVILAVYKSLQSEGFGGEKWHFLGKSKLEKVMEQEFKKLKPSVDLKNYDTVQAAKDSKALIQLTCTPVTLKANPEITLINKHYDSVLQDAKPRPAGKKSLFGNK